MPSNWEVLLHDAFVEELEQINESLQDELLAHAKLLGNATKESDFAIRTLQIPHGGNPLPPNFFKLSFSEHP